MSQVGTPLEEDLASWGHHSTSKSVPDMILQASAGDEVSCLSEFIFQSNQSLSQALWYRKFRGF